MNDGQCANLSLNVINFHFKILYLSYTSLRMTWWRGAARLWSRAKRERKDAKRMTGETRYAGFPVTLVKNHFDSWRQRTEKPNERPTMSFDG